RHPCPTRLPYTTLFRSKSERVVTGPTLFDDIPDPNPPPAADAPVAPVAPPDSTIPKRRGHGRRPRPSDLPRERVEIDLSEAEKADRKSTRLNSSHQIIP